MKVLDKKAQTPVGNSKTVQAKGGQSMAPPAFNLTAGSQPVQAKSAETFPFKANVHGASALMLRSGPKKTEDNAIGKFAKGAEVEVIGKSGGWYKVKGKAVGGKDKEGYAYHKYISSSVNKVNKMTEDVDADMTELWGKSFNADKTAVEEWGAVVAEKDGAYTAKNKKTDHNGGSVSYNEGLGADEKLAGQIHTHPYSVSEGSEEGVAWSSGDISNLRGHIKKDFIKLLEAGNRRFSLMITDEKKAKKFYDANDANAIKTKWDAGFAKGKGTFQKKCISAVYNVIGKGEVNGIAFYGTFDKGKTKFDKV